MAAMMWVRTLLFGVVLFLCASPAAARAKLEPGQKAPAFNLKDGSGKEYALEQSLGGKCAVVMFIATRCPVSNRYNDRMVALYDDYAQKGITFLAINSNKQESMDEVREHARSHGFRFPVLKDEGNKVADSYGAQVTPEIFVVDAKGIVRYHGRIDDNMDPGEVQSHDLRAALDALLRGKEIPRTETKAFGCSIKRVGGDS